MNRNLTVDQLDGLLDEPNLATLATMRDDGLVALSPVWFVWEDGGFLIGITHKDAKLRHLRRDPRVTVVVAERGFPMRGFEARGTAELTDRPYGANIRRIAGRYVGDAAAAFFDDDRRGIIVRIEPTEARGWDFRDDLTAMGVSG